MTNDGPITNDTLNLVPQAEWSGRRLEFDFPALHVGVAAYPEGPTGCTVYYFPKGATDNGERQEGLQQGDFTPAGRAI